MDEQIIGSDGSSDDDVVVVVLRRAAGEAWQVETVHGPDRVAVDTMVRDAIARAPRPNRGVQATFSWIDEAAKWMKTYGNPPLKLDAWQIALLRRAYDENARRAHPLRL